MHSTFRCREREAAACFGKRKERGKKVERRQQRRKKKTISKNRNEKKKLEKGKEILPLASPLRRPPREAWAPLPWPSTPGEPG